MENIAPIQIAEPKREKRAAVELLAVEAARKDGNTGLLYQIYKYVEFKKGERRKHEEF